LPYFELKYYTIKDYTTALLIPIGVDKSCCGPHNGNIFKRTEKFMDSLEESQKIFNLLTIGNRVRDYFRKYYSSYLVSHIYNIDKEPLSLVISFAVSEKILADVKDRYFFIFNRYYSPFLQKTKSYEVAGIKAFYGACFNTLEYRRKISKSEEIFNSILKIETGTLHDTIVNIYYKCFSMLVLDVLEENEYSSVGARVTAMDNSTQNAAKMIDIITLMYNKARQANITNELIEIVSAANFVI